MPSIKVLIATALPPPLTAELTALDQGLEVTALDERQRRLLRPGLAQDQSEEARALRDWIGDSEVIFASFDAPRDLHELAGKARWIHTVAAGVEELLEQGFGRGAYVFTNGSGPHAIGIGEYIVMQALMLVKGAPGYLRQQIEHRWARLPMTDRGARTELNGQTVGIVGLGDIGLAAAERLRALGCRIVASRRSAAARQENVGPVHELLPAADLPYLLRTSDIVVLTLPLTRETHHLINAETLGLMKRDAYLINISRGGVIDEPALVAALRERRIAGAALDVFETEPLPASSPLWDLPNVVITPHVSTTSEHFLRRQVDLFEENLRRYRAGEPLLNQVDADRGY